MFYRRIAVKYGQITALLGAYIGICLDVMYLGGTAQDINRTGSKCKVILRFIVVIILYMPIFFC